jgi:hypothetical protein
MMMMMMMMNLMMMMMRRRRIVGPGIHSVGTRKCVLRTMSHVHQ